MVNSKNVAKEVSSVAKPENVVQRDCNVTQSKNINPSATTTVIVPSENSLDATQTSETEKKFTNGLIKDPMYYLDVENYSYIVAKRQNSLSPCNNSMAKGLLSNVDYKSLHKGNISICCMNFITDYLIRHNNMNLTLFAEDVISGVVPFKFSIHEKICFMPYFDGVQWSLYIFNTKRNTMCYLSTYVDEEDTVPATKLQEFNKFIEAYNATERKNKLNSIKYWNSVTLESKQTIKHSSDSGILIAFYIHQLAHTGNLQDNRFDAQEFRKILQQEVLQHSENLTEVCLKCGEVDDSSNSDKISWTSCDICERWLHDTCIEETITGSFKCNLCKRQESL